MLSLWSIMRSPLFMGGDLPRTDAFTLSLLTNPEVIAVDQDSRDNRPVLDKGDFTVWTAATADGQARYVAVFNLGETRGTFRAAWQELGMAGARHEIRDLWRRRALGKAAGLETELGPHASAMFRVSVP